MPEKGYKCLNWSLCNERVIPLLAQAEAASGGRTEPDSTENLTKALLERRMQPTARFSQHTSHANHTTAN